MMKRILAFGMVMSMVSMVVVGCGKQSEVSYIDGYVTEVVHLADGYDHVTVELDDGDLYRFVEKRGEYHAPYCKIAVIDGVWDRLV